MQIIDVWDVQQWDGGDRHNHDFYLLRAAATQIELESKFKHSCVFAQSLIILNGLDEVERMRTEKARQTALAKLTLKEREILGLK